MAVEIFMGVYRTEKDLRPYNASRYSLYGNLRSSNYCGGVEPLLSWEYVHGNQGG
jgi:hypothetical protein